MCCVINSSQGSTIEISIHISDISHDESVADTIIRGCHRDISAIKQRSNRVPWGCCSRLKIILIDEFIVAVENTALEYSIYLEGDRIASVIEGGDLRRGNGPLNVEAGNAPARIDDSCFDPRLPPVLWTHPTTKPPSIAAQTVKSPFVPPLVWLIVKAAPLGVPSALKI
jgi:hypothetical protein